ncbi:MAG: AAA family ATPase [Ruminococcaceae bacterium]|nr:AAA family ATPase [Oscillospiraceae bacterium]
MSNEKRMLELLEKTFFCESEHHGATDAEIEAAGMQMIARLGVDGIDVPQIPKDYAAFLRLTDGYAWNGVCFFSTKPTPMGNRYTNPSLFDKNDYYLRMKSGLNGCLVVGSFDDEIYVYSSKTGMYHALDELTLIPMEDDGCEDFAELFLCAVGELYESCFVDEDDEEDEEETVPGTTGEDLRRSLFLSALGDTARACEVREIMERVERLAGAEEFKAYCRWLRTVSESEDATYLRDYCKNGALCFAIGGGNGFTTYVSLLSELLTALKVKTIEHRPKVPEIKKADSDKEVVEEFERLSENSDIIAVDMGFRVERAGTAELRSFLRRLARERGGLLPVFKIPYSEGAEKEKIVAELGAVFPLFTIAVPPLSTADYAAAAAGMAARLGGRVEPDAVEGLEKLIVEKRNREHFYGFRSIRALVSDVIYQKNLIEAREGTEMSLVITKEDVRRALNQWEDEHGGSEQLDELIGVDEVKSRIDEIVVQLELAKEQPSAERPCMHMLFTGNPGTGKTTVARILGRILKEKGVLSKGQFYERTGRDLVGRYIGETAPITNALCRDAYGSILFIDEAYTLYRSSDDGKDFGREALDTLITQMENHRQDFIVILSGYGDEMKLLLEANPGLASRIPHEIRFRNFTREELAKIYMRMAGKKYRCAAGLEREAEAYFLSLSEKTLNNKAFANARFVRNLYERTVSKAALRHQAETGERIVSGASIELTAADFRNAAEAEEFQMLREKSARAIGFV